jgi:hypothetical protein
MSYLRQRTILSDAGEGDLSRMAKISCLHYISVVFSSDRRGLLLSNSNGNSNRIKWSSCVHCGSLYIVSLSKACPISVQGAYVKETT